MITTVIKAGREFEVVSKNELESGCMASPAVSGDMLILRTFYDPALQTGMSEPEVAARLPAVLNRLNPRGRSAGIGRWATSPRGMTT